MKNRITSLDVLKMVKAHKRLDEVMPKPTVTTDRKKKESKLACRKKIRPDGD